MLHKGKELKLLQDTYTKLLAFKEQRQDFWIRVPALQEFADTKYNHASHSAETQMQMTAKGPFVFKGILHGSALEFGVVPFSISKTVLASTRIYG